MSEGMFRDFGHALIARNGRAEDITIDAVLTLGVAGREPLRPVYCPGCGLHYTDLRPRDQGASIAHVPCANCAAGLPRAEDLG